MHQVSILDFGVGNIKSILNALRFLNISANIIESAGDASDCMRLILPGVGAFSPAMGRLTLSGIGDAVKERCALDRPTLGVCLGMQLLCSGSTEDGEHEGLGVFDADVIAFDPSIEFPVPHMGWNSLHHDDGHVVLRGIPSGSDVYFAHSFHVANRGDAETVARTTYGRQFVSVIAKDHTIGTQFHPEKSQGVGLALLANFAAL